MLKLNVASVILMIAGSCVFAELQGRVSLPNDWHLRNAYIPQNIIPETKEAVVVAVVDDGIRLTHEQLEGFIWTNKREIPGNNIDDDGNGYVDDVHGWDAGDNDNTPTPPEDRLKGYYHGTHLAGIITQVAKRAYEDSASKLIKIMPVKALSDRADKMYIQQGYEGIDYAIKSGADVILCAWGQAFIAQHKSAILDKAGQKGIYIVSSAGNFPQDRPQYPAGHKAVLAVAALSPGNKKIEKSNYGSFVDLSVMGIDIESAGVISDKAAVKHTGTSFAAAITAGAVAVMKLQHPGYSPAEITACLKSSAVYIDDKNPKYCGKLGAGKLNLKKAIDAEIFNKPVEKENSLINPQGYLLANRDNPSTSWQINLQGKIKGIRIKPAFMKGSAGKSTLKIYTHHQSDETFIESFPVSNLPESIYIPGSSGTVKIEIQQADSEFQCLLEYRAEPINIRTLYCSGTVELNEEGFFDDGSGDEPYSPGCSCKWLITAPQGKIIRIRFTEFDTEPQVDFVHFFNGAKTNETIMAMFSGPDIPPELTTWTNQVLVWFVSDEQNQGRGFRAEFEFIDEE